MQWLQLKKKRTIKDNSKLGNNSRRGNKIGTELKILTCRYYLMLRPTLHQVPLGTLHMMTNSSESSFSISRKLSGNSRNKLSLKMMRE